MYSRRCCLLQASSGPNLNLLLIPSSYWYSPLSFYSSCTTCVDGLFHHPTAHCPECDKLLRRNEYRAQQFEDASVEREVDIRKRILKE